MKTLLVRVAGAVLIAAGVGALCLVAFTTWLGDAGADEAQEQLAADFDAVRERPATTLRPLRFRGDDPTIEADVPLAVTTLPLTVTTLPWEDVVVPERRTTTTVPAVLLEAAPPQGEPVGRIVIPAADVDWVMVEGVTENDLAKGPGHMPGTALPGQPGNAVVSGHRTTHGAPFFSLDALTPGDEITVETLIGVHTYAVVEVIIVDPTDAWVTRQVEGAWLTLTTCNPRYSARERLIVFSRLVDGPNAEAVEATLDGDETPPRPPGA